MTEKQRIVFLDIDGPIINTPMFYLDPMCSMQRTQLNTQAIAYVKRLCMIADAKVVFNTTHNNHFIIDELTGINRSIKDDMIRWGLPDAMIHKDWRTNYPNWGDSRMRAVDEWIEGQGDSEIDWVAFDDVLFTNSKRLILIDYEKGIDYAAYRKAAKTWGFRNDPLILF